MRQNKYICCSCKSVWDRSSSVQRFEYEDEVYHLCHACLDVIVAKEIPHLLANQQLPD